MKIKLNFKAMKMMLNWLEKAQQEGIRDESKLIEILSMPEYETEFERYGSSLFSVCPINKEEAVDFFMHFDQKEFANERLALKKQSFMNFYKDLSNRIKNIEPLLNISDNGVNELESVVENSIPNESIKEFNLNFAISFGNSFYAEYQNSIIIDLAMLEQFMTLDEFIHFVAHNISQICINDLLVSKKLAPREVFLLSFAGEGLVAHFCDNFGTIYKPSKYNAPAYGVDSNDIKLYEEHFDELFEEFKTDYEEASIGTLEEVIDALSKYEAYEFMDHVVTKNALYYLGCYLFGLVDLEYGKEKLYEAIKTPSLFKELYNEIAPKKYKL